MSSQSHSHVMMTGRSQNSPRVKLIAMMMMMFSSLVGLVGVVKRIEEEDPVAALFPMTQLMLPLIVPISILRYLIEFAPSSSSSSSSLVDSEAVRRT